MKKLLLSLLIAGAVQNSLAMQNEGNEFYDAILATEYSDIDNEYVNGETELMRDARIGYLRKKIPNDGGVCVNATDKDGMRALNHATWCGKTNIACTLISEGAEVDARDLKGNTALMNAASIGNAETLEILIDAGSDVNARDNDGLTALMLADRSNYRDCAKILIDAGADCSGIDKITLFDDTIYGGYRAPIFTNLFKNKEKRKI